MGLPQPWFTVKRYSLDSHDLSPQTCTKISFMAVELGQKGTWNGRWSSCLRFAWHWDIEKPRGRRKTAKGPRTSSVPPGHSEKKTDPSNLCERKMQTIYKSIFVALFFLCEVCEGWGDGCRESLCRKNPEARTSVSMAGPFWENLDLCWTRGAGAWHRCLAMELGGAIWS